MVRSQLQWPYVNAERSFQTSPLFTEFPTINGLIMPNRISFPWGPKSLQIDLPESWNILGELKPKPVAAFSDVYESCCESLASPIAGTRLADRRLTDASVTVVVDDHSRPTPKMFV